MKTTYRWRKRLLATLLAALFTASLSVPPAFAIDSDTGTGGTDTGNVGGDGSNWVYACGRNGDGYLAQRSPFLMVQAQFRAPFLDCQPGEYGRIIDWKVSTGRQMCITGVEVWRFYGYDPGTTASKIAAWTRSRIALNKLCDTTSASKWRAVSPHADDNASQASSPSLLPWRGSTRTSPEEFHYAYDADGYLTTLPPQKRGGADCSTLMSGAPGQPANLITEALSSGDAILVQKTLDYLNTSYRALQPSYGSTARVQVNAKSAPVTAGSYEDGYACSGGVDFARENTDQPLYTGQCTVRLNAMMRKFTRGTRSEWGLYNDRLAGERYTNIGSTGTGTSATAWRSVIKQDARTRSMNVDKVNSDRYGAPYKSASDFPATTSMTNRDAAANAAARFARCGLSPITVGRDSESNDTFQEMAYVEVKVTLPDELQVGGTYRQYQFKAEKGVSYCINKDGGVVPCTGGAGITCPINTGWGPPCIESLKFDLVLEGTGSYSACASALDKGCAYWARRTGPAVSGASNFVQSSVMWDGWFYKATFPSERFVVKLTNGAGGTPSATYRMPRTKYEARTACYTYTIPSSDPTQPPSYGQYCFQYYVEVPDNDLILPLPIKLVIVKGPNPTSAWRWDYKVIGSGAQT